ncbi:Glycosyltransferase involved in cell wall bisynthesis [Faunimonas pinastri]|uniref:Glycosyltransferase involved in cell wall bisynthesis n=1 Tax=Faunimonas pinastri TaxID=1855383 RepID=A0A1H9D4J2_9HYPH|nr:glycosyltransferase family 4 protein [Faunimonas pinastri]SEQ08410.1 Glycosyltransferase involved in cell wall bisynthesis [Faunimonas pinastri]
MRILFVHQNFPGQYKHIVEALAREPGHELVALTINNHPVPQAVRKVLYKPARSSSTEIHPYAVDYEAKLIRGEAAARAAMDLKAKGFKPDIICGHPGWGELLFLRDIWPDVPILSYLEFYYRAIGADHNFDPEFADQSLEGAWRLRAKNAGFLIDLEAMDWGVSPTKWQWQQLPEFAKARTTVLHDGVDTDHVRPSPDARIQLGRAGECRPGDEIITFVNRNLEPYRGYHSFIRALPEILKRRPKARAVLVGGDAVSYGKKAPEGQSWKQIFLNEVKDSLDLSRVHFVGKIPYGTYLNLLQVSAAHVYLTYPFVLSWSMLESMAAGCLLIGSDTPPVREVLDPGRNGLLVDFFSPGDIAETVVKALENPGDYRDMRRAARATVVEQYDLKRVCLPGHLKLIRDVAAHRAPQVASTSATVPAAQAERLTA